MYPQEAVRCWKALRAEHCQESLQYWTKFFVRDYWGEPKQNRFFGSEFYFFGKKAHFRLSQENQTLSK